MKKIEITNVLSKPSGCPAFYYGLIKDSRFVAEGEGIMYYYKPSENIIPPEHIKTLCRNGVDTENTKVCVADWFTT